MMNDRNRGESIYREREMRLLESDSDKAVKRLGNMTSDSDVTANNVDG